MGRLTCEPRALRQDCSGVPLIVYAKASNPMPLRQSAYDAIVEGGHMTDIKDIPTCELVSELRSREGVETTVLSPTAEATVSASGPALVLVVID